MNIPIVIFLTFTFGIPAVAVRFGSARVARLSLWCFLAGPLLACVWLGVRP